MVDRKSHYTHSILEYNMIYTCKEIIRHKITKNKDLGRNPYYTSILSVRQKRRSKLSARFSDLCKTKSTE